MSDPMKTYVWEHEATWRAALENPNHPWHGCAVSIEPELRRLRAELDMARQPGPIDWEDEAMKSLEGIKWRDAEIERLDRDRGNLLMASRQALARHARGDDEHALDALREIVRGLSRAEDVLRRATSSDAGSRDE